MTSDELIQKLTEKNLQLQDDVDRALALVEENNKLMDQNIEFIEAHRRALTEDIRIIQQACVVYRTFIFLLFCGTMALLRFGSGPELLVLLITVPGIAIVWWDESELQKHVRDRKMQSYCKRRKTG